MPDNLITVTGNTTRDPELRFTSGGQATLTLGLAVNRRWFDKAADEWKEQTSFFNVVCWRDLAENVAESCPRGTRVVVVGRLEQREYEDKEGNKRQAIEIIADEVAPSLRWAQCRVEKTERRTSDSMSI